MASRRASAVVGAAMALRRRYPLLSCMVTCSVLRRRFFFLLPCLLLVVEGDPVPGNI